MRAMVYSTAQHPAWCAIRTDFLLILEKRRVCCILTSIIITYYFSPIYLLPHLSGYLNIRMLFAYHRASGRKHIFIDKETLIRVSL